ncbi:Six-hairpin glycosidase-like protein [Ilyonectria destructans]|nr:Six-hairpin glycosidase-like protein [Ilyonectria destructans]
MANHLDFTIPGLLPRPVYESRVYGRDETPAHLLPVKIHSTIGHVSAADTLLSDSSAESVVLIKTSASDPNPSIIADFGVAVAGIPFINVSAIIAPAGSIVVDFAVSEGYPGIKLEDGDGPYPFSAGADTSRKARFRVGHTGFHDAKYIQGSQRWMKITLSSPGPCCVAISRAGFIPATSNVPVDRLPGQFECSDTSLNELWGYGARTIQLNCAPERTIPPPWQVSEDMGVLIDSQRCNSYGWGGEWSDYDAEFDALVIEGGLAYVFFQLTVTDERTILEMWWGYYNKQQTTLVPILISSADISTQVELNKWYRFKTRCVGDEPFVISINGKEVATFRQGNIKASGLSLMSTPVDASNFPYVAKGAVGIGAGADQVCRFKNMLVRSVPSQEILYTSGLNTPAVLSDFGVGWNQFPFIFDGAKRDRYPWTADIIVGGKTLYYSTGGTEFVRGNIVASMLRCKGSKETPGLFPSGAPPGIDFSRPRGDTMFCLLAVNYSLYLILVIYDYWTFTGDDDLLLLCWDKIEGCLAYCKERLNDDNLISVSGMDAGDYDYYNGIQEGVSTKRNAIYVAVLRACAKMAASEVISDAEMAASLLSAADITAKAVLDKCYNPANGYFNITDSRTTGFQQETHAWLLLTNIVPPELKTQILSHFASLCTTSHNSAPLSFSPDTTNPSPPPVISPIMSAIHVDSAVHAGEKHTVVEEYLRRVWEPMMDKSSEHFTGTTWEFMTAEGKPFKGGFCSYAQLFSSGPTWLLSAHVLGVQPLEPAFDKYMVWPKLRLNGVNWARGRVPTPRGSIFVAWEEKTDGWRLTVKAPRGLSGVVVIPDEIWNRNKDMIVGDGSAQGSKELAVGLDGTLYVTIRF